MLKKDYINWTNLKNKKENIMYIHEDIEALEAFLGRLIELRDNGARWLDSGICRNAVMRLLPTFSRTLVYEIFLSWECATFDECYPVPATGKPYSEYGMYWSAINHWIDLYGELRLELLDHTITGVTSALEQLKADQNN